MGVFYFLINQIRKGVYMLTGLSIVGAEELVMHAVHWLKLMVEVTGALVIGIGLLATLTTWIRSIRISRVRSKTQKPRIQITLRH